MRTLRHLVFSAAAEAFLLFCTTSLSAQTPHDPTDLACRSARHFPEKPPVSFELAETTDHRPLVIITNSYQYPLTAYVVQTEPKSAVDTQIYDALTRIGGLLAPIPRGLTHKTGIPNLGGGPVPDAKLAAAVWEDGSTFGTDELLARISNSRKAQADSYDLAIATLQTGIEKNWSIQEYIAAAQKLRPPLPPQPATVEEARATSERLTATMLPSITMRDNMQHSVQQDRSSARVAKLAQLLLKDFEQSRDSLRQALGESTAMADRAKTR